MQRYLKTPAQYFYFFFGTAVALGLYASSLYSYLLFHSLVELFSVLTAFVVFVLAWNTRRVQDNHYLLFIGIASLSTGALDLVHTLAYKGMGVFPGYDSNLATQLWVAFRYVFSLSLLIAPFYILKKLKPESTFAIYFVVTAIILAAVFLRRFPDCFIEGKGLTPFKIASEYIICLIFLAALGVLIMKRSDFDRMVLRLMVLSLLSSVVSELNFTQYVSVFGFANLAGHYFELLSYVLIYRAIVITGVVEPSSLLFRNLKLSEEALRESEARYRSLFENMIDAFAFHKIVVDEQGKPVDYIFLEVNNAFEKLTGLKRQDIIGKRVTDAIPGIENDPADWIGLYGRVALSGEESRFEQHAEGLGKWFSVSAYSPMKDHFVAVFEDITGRKQLEEALNRSHEELERRVQERTEELARTNEDLESEIADRMQVEDKISRLNRLYSVLSKVNEAIVRIHDPEKLYERVCRIAVEDGLFKMAWIGLVDPETRNINPVVSYGDAGGYLNDIRISAADVTAGRGPTGKAVFKGTYSSCGDIEHDPRMLPWRDKALQHGFRSSAAFPLRAGSAVIGAFTIYSGKPQFFTDEEIILLSSMAEDISFAIDSIANEKKRLEAEEALHKSAEEIEDLYNNAPCGYHSLDKNGVIVQINDTELQWLDYRRDEVAGKMKLADVLTAESFKAFEVNFPRFKERGLIRDVEYEFVRRDGSILPVLLSATAIKDGNGDYVMSRATVYDVTELKETENRIKVTNDLLKLYSGKYSRNEYLDAAVNLIRGWSGCRCVGMRIADRDGNIPYESFAGFNKEFLESERLLSLRRDRCVCTRVVAGTPEAQDMPAMTRAGSFYSNNTMQFVGGLTDEQKTRFRGVCIRSGFTSVAVIPILYRDVILGAIHLTDEREGMVPPEDMEFIEQLALIIGEAVFRFGIEDELRQLNRELEQRVIERTAQLEAANKELEAFAYSVSHDLRAPLRVIDGFSRAIEEEQAGRLDDTGKDYFRRVRAAAGRMGQLIDALLSLSRHTRGEPDRVTVDLGSLVKAAADNLRKTRPGRTVEFVIADGITVEGDPAMLRAAVDNLLENAWKFTEKRESAQIEFGVTRKDDKDVYFVRDNGAGFDMTYANKLFTAFQRLHTADEFPGLGIGLATVQRVIHRHGGRIWAEAEVNKGATFYFTLQ